MLVTALVTPFVDGGARLDLPLVQRLVSFQLDQGCDQVLLCGTTGEGGALDDDEKLAMLDAAVEAAGPDDVMMAAGGGSVDAVIARARTYLERGVRDLLVMDVPYMAPCSAALRETWHAPIAEALPDARIVVYTVPGRTGAELLPDDLARLVEDHPNVVAVKDACGRLARMTRVRELCGDAFDVYCGDDHLLRDAMLDPAIRADGGICFSGNVVPSTLAELVEVCEKGDAVRARELHEDLSLVTGLLAVTTEETVTLRGEPYEVPQRCKNPVPVKTALGLLGVMEASFRAPLAPMGPSGISRVRSMLRLAASRCPGLLRPLQSEFGAEAELAGAAP